MLRKLVEPAWGPHKAAEIQPNDVDRLLRHTLASPLVSCGMTLPMIGNLLSHKQVQTTQHYAHLLNDPLRAGLETSGDMLRAKLRLMPLQTSMQIS